VNLHVFQVRPKQRKVSSHPPSSISPPPISPSTIPPSPYLSSRPLGQFVYLKHIEYLSVLSVYLAVHYISNLHANLNRPVK
jgi:hypothetical protein